MDLSKLRAIGNNFREVRLISLRDWPSAREFEPRDSGGPYMVVQDGYSPNDLTMSYDEYVLGRSGTWLPTGLFLKLPKEVRREEYIFGLASEVIELLRSLGGKARVLTRLADLEESEDRDDDLARALLEAREQTGP